DVGPESALVAAGEPSGDAASSPVPATVDRVSLPRSSRRMRLFPRSTMRRLPPASKEAWMGPFSCAVAAGASEEPAAPVPAPAVAVLDAVTRRIALFTWSQTKTPPPLAAGIGTTHEGALNCAASAPPATPSPPYPAVPLP